MPGAVDLPYRASRSVFSIVSIPRACLCVLIQPTLAQRPCRTCPPVTRGPKWKTVIGATGGLSGRIDCYKSIGSTQDAGHTQRRCTMRGRTVLGIFPEHNVRQAYTSDIAPLQPSNRQLMQTMQSIGELANQ